jgi:hypothetical protein
MKRLREIRKIIARPLEFSHSDRGALLAALGSFRVEKWVSPADIHARLIPKSQAYGNAL